MTVLFALLASSASAAGLDPSFGNGGKTTVAVDVENEESPGTVHLALGRDGRVYVLEDSHLLAFEADGTPAAGFGVNGQVTLAPVGEDIGAVGLAVDSRGRVLVTGSVDLGFQERDGLRVGYAPIYVAYVIRLLPGGERDPSFGTDGEAQTTFGLPGGPAMRDATERPRASAIATSIVVDSRDRPIVGGGYVAAGGGCLTPLISSDPFVGRLTATGAPDTTFAGKGYALVGGLGEVSALARTPDGVATLSHGIACGARSVVEPSRVNAFTEGGKRSPRLDPKRPKFYLGRGTMAIDPRGRSIVVQVPPPEGEEPATLDRQLPNGDLDPSFGKKGRVILDGPLRAETAFTVDSQSRPILATARNGLELRRLDADGTLDGSFGPGGRLYAHAPYAQAVALDGEGRIYTVEEIEGTKRKPGERIQVARFLPGS